MGDHCNDEIVYKDEVQGITYYRRGTKKGNIYVYFRVNNKAYRFSSGEKSIEAAAMIANERKSLARKGKEIKTVTFRKAFEKFIDYKSDHIQLSSVNDYRRIAKLLNSEIGDLDIRKLDGRKIHDLIRWRKNYYLLNKEKSYQSYVRKGKKIKGRKFNQEVGNRTINMMVVTILAVIRYAAKEMRYIDERDIPKVKLLKENVREEFITEQEMILIRNYYIEKKKHYYADIVSFAFYTGIRLMSELNRIKWSDVDFERNIVIVRNRKHRSKTLHTAVPLHKHAKETLNNIKLRNLPISKISDSFVFVEKNGDQVKSITKSFKSAVKNCGIDKNLTPYSLRHGFATFAITKIGLPMAYIAEIMGHANTSSLSDLKSLGNKK